MSSGHINLPAKNKEGLRRLTEFMMQKLWRGHPSPKWTVSQKMIGLDSWAGPSWVEVNDRPKVDGPKDYSVELGGHLLALKIVQFRPFRPSAFLFQERPLFDRSL